MSRRSTPRPWCSAVAPSVPSARLGAERAPGAVSRSPEVPRTPSGSLSSMIVFAASFRRPDQLHLKRLRCWAHDAQTRGALSRSLAIGCVQQVEQLNRTARRRGSRLQHSEERVRVAPVRLQPKSVSGARGRSWTTWSRMLGRGGPGGCLPASPGMGAGLESGLGSGFPSPTHRDRGAPAPPPGSGVGRDARGAISPTPHSQPPE
jgi:hypothetical protein